MPLDEQSRRLTKFAIGNQQYEFNRLFYGIFIGPAAFSAFMSKIFRPKKKNLTDKINLSGPPNNDSKYTINQVFNLHDPLDTISLSKTVI